MRTDVQVIDVQVTDDGGSLFVVNPLNDKARAWLADNVDKDEGFQPYWPTVIVEHRYIDALVGGMRREGGLTVGR